MRIWKNGNISKDFRKKKYMEFPKELKSNNHMHFNFIP